MERVQDLRMQMSFIGFMSICLLRLELSHKSVFLVLSTGQGKCNLWQNVITVANLCCKFADLSCSG